MLRPFADPLLKDAIDLGHHLHSLILCRCNVRIGFDRRKDAEPEVRAIEALDPHRNQIASEAQRQTGRNHRCQLVQSEERQRHSAVVAMVHYQAQGSALVQSSDQMGKAGVTVEQLTAEGLAFTLEHAVDEGILDRCIDHRERYGHMGGRTRRDLPVSEMRRDENGLFSADSIGVQIHLRVDLEMVVDGRLHQPPEMRIFGEHGARIAPDLANEIAFLVVVQVRKGQAQIAQHVGRFTQARPDEPEQSPPETRSRIRRQAGANPPEQAENSRFYRPTRAAQDRKPVDTLAEGLGEEEVSHFASKSDPSPPGGRGVFSRFRRMYAWIAPFR